MDHGTDIRDRKAALVDLHAQATTLTTRLGALKADTAGAVDLAAALRLLADALDLLASPPAPVPLTIVPDPPLVSEPPTEVTTPRRPRSR